MAENIPYLSIKLDLEEPVEISDFAALFSGFGSQFEEYVRDSHPKAAGSIHMYVREVRQGSVIADLFAQIPDMIGIMDDALIVTGFAALFSKRIRTWVNGSFVDEAKKSTLRDAGRTVRAVANANKGKAVLTSYRHVNGFWTETIEAEFTVPEARRAEETIEAQMREMDRKSDADFSRVLMTFKRSDKDAAEVGKPSGERVVISDVAENDLALVYSSSLAEDRIKDVMNDPEQNIFHKAFLVDVNVEIRNGKAIAYKVTHVYQVIDIPPYDA